MPRNVKEIPSFVYDPSCVLYLPLWKRDGATFISDDARGHLCTVTGATHGIQGRTFDGIDNKITAPALLGAVTERTIVFWLKIPSSDSSNRGVFDFITGGQGNPALSIIGTAEFLLRLGTLNYGRFSISAYNNDQWHCYSLYIAGGGINDINNCTLTIDAGSPQAIYDLATGDPADDWTQFNIGVSNYGYLNGTIGEVCGYNRARTALEIQQIYLSTKWRFR